MELKLNGTTVYAEVRGDRGSHVLLLHGWGCNTSLMLPLADQLAGNHKVYIPDFPGHGKSGKPTEPWGVPEYAECILEFIRETGIAPCTVVAHSFGCRVATILEAEHPELFTRIIFTGAAGIRKQDNGTVSARTAKYKKLRSIAETVGKLPGMKKISEDLGERLVQKYGSPDYAALDAEMRKTFVRVINQDLTEYYPRFTHPTLLVWGRQDTETPLWMGKKMEELIPDAGLVELDGDHFVYLKQLPRFAVILKAFMTEE